MGEAGGQGGGALDIGEASGRHGVGVRLSYQGRKKPWEDSGSGGWRHGVLRCWTPLTRLLGLMGRGQDGGLGHGQVGMVVASMGDSQVGDTAMSGLSGEEGGRRRGD